MSQFKRYIGIDYSGAETPSSSLKGLSVYSATPDSTPVEIPPPPSPRKYWTRRGLAQWLADELTADVPTLVGIDHAFSFPIRYFEKHQIPPDWAVFLDDFQQHWPTDGEHVYVEFVRDGAVGDGAARSGSSRWRRLTEERCRAKSVFHFDVQGSVAKASHAGIPWLRYLRQQLSSSLHCWPFDGWQPPMGHSVIAEVYPALWSRAFPREARNSHQHDAYSTVRWMQQNDALNSLPEFFNPELGSHDRAVAQVEGWILGVA